MFKKKAHLNAESKIVSFTFDDFPQTAISNGLGILDKYHCKGTFYVSYNLLGSDSPSGKIAEMNDIKEILKNNHELACHTYAHLDCYNNSIERIVDDCKYNRDIIKKKTGIILRSFAYPKGNIKPLVKREISKCYETARTIERGINRDMIDLAALKSVPLYYKYGKDRCMEWLNRLDEKGGWLIFYTHDVRTNPSIYGCTIELMEDIIIACQQRNFKILSIGETAKSI